ncbi:hypothetical protein C8Q70DRAFT_195192 [Cubamyces menziesii]|nr:hypothetical protein C8Q70DRAFT_195192 [Cubamyces menziesii]
MNVLGPATLDTGQPSGTHHPHPFRTRRPYALSNPGLMDALAIVQLRPPTILARASARQRIPRSACARRLRTDCAIPVDHPCVCAPKAQGLTHAGSGSLQPAALRRGDDACRNATQSHCPTTSMVLGVSDLRGRAGHATAFEKIVCCAGWSERSCAWECALRAVGAGMWGSGQMSDGSGDGEGFDALERVRRSVVARRRVELVLSRASASAGALTRVDVGGRSLLKMTHGLQD